MWFDRQRDRIGLLLAAKDGISFLGVTLAQSLLFKFGARCGSAGQVLAD